jgi:hypothetical protein
MSKYTLSSRKFHRGLIGQTRTEHTAQTVLEDGKYLSDVPADCDGEALVRDLNAQAEEYAAYRAQFATEEDWQRHLAEND